MWKLNDYKELSIHTSKTYKHALRLGVPHDLTKNLSANLHSFKTVYRTQYKPDRALLSLGGPNKDYNASGNDAFENRFEREDIYGFGGGNVQNAS